MTAQIHLELCWWCYRKICGRITKLWKHKYKCGSIKLRICSGL